MIRSFSLSELAPKLSARFIGNNVSFNGVSIDSRTIKKGQLFIALKGLNFDGHNYIEIAAENGAVAVLVDKFISDCCLPQLIVSDTRIALGRIGAFNRDQYHAPIIGITGSSGKTTVKEMLASILRIQYVGLDSVLVTHGNLNNELGVPLTLLKLAQHHHCAVVEMGASHIGDITYTANLVKADTVLITNAGMAHVGEFGSIENIVQTKGEILDGLLDSSRAILNKDDKAFDSWSDRANPAKIISFSIEDATSDVYTTKLQADARGCFSFCLRSQEESIEIQLNVLGRHNIANALSASAIATSLGIDLVKQKKGLEAFQPVKGRLVSHLINKTCVIDDTYNANPASVRAAIDILAGFAGRKVLVLGDIGELGSWAEQAHRDIGLYARLKKIDALYVLGKLTPFTATEFGDQSYWFETHEDLIAALRQEKDDITLLVKGSRSAKMERIVDALCTQPYAGIS